MSGHITLDRFLRTNPHDVGCDDALAVLHICVDLLLDDAAGQDAASRYRGVAAHLLAGGPGAGDDEGVLTAAGGPVRS